MKKVCIYALDDGTYSVEEEREEMEMRESPASPMDMQEDAAEGAPEQVVATLDEALQIAAGLLDGEQQPQGAGKPMMEGEDAFVSGFKQARGIDQGF